MARPDISNRDYETDVWLDRLEQLANLKAASSSDAGELEKAASAASLIAKARLAREDLKSRRFRLRLDEARSWAFLAIPFLILIALLIYAPTPNRQAQVMKEAAEDAQFHEVERNFVTQVTQTGTLVRPDLLLLTTPLQPYLADSRYEKQAWDLSILALSHAASSDAFQDYFVSRNIHLNDKNLASFLTLDRALYTNFSELDDALNSDVSANMSTIVGRPLTKDQGQRARDGILLELTFLSTRVASEFRRKGQPLNVDLRRVYFKGVDLGNLVFGQSNLDGCQWEQVSLTGSDLSSITGFDNSQWIDVNWWDARLISKPLLSYLIANQYPYHPPVVDYTNAPGSREVYVSKVMKLCGAVGLTCNASTLPFGTLPKIEKKPKAPVAAPVNPPIPAEVPGT